MLECGGKEQAFLGRNLDMSEPSDIRDKGLQFGYQDHSYQAAGKEVGLRKLCTEFYRYMDTLKEVRVVREMHKEDLDIMVDKLTLFLCGWLGGPRMYAQKYGAIRLPMAHREFRINEEERDQWLLCMYKAIDDQDNYSQTFKNYLKEQFAVPAERIRQAAKS